MMPESPDESRADRSATPRGVAMLWARYGATAGIVVAALATLLPILWTPYTGDDIINETIPQVMVDEHVSRWWIIRELTSDWINFQGRFFPGAVTYGVLVFTTFTTRVAYKAFLLVLWMLALVTIGAWIRRLSRDQGLALVVCLCTIGTLTFRYPFFHDGVTAYAGLLPWALLLFALVLALTVRRPESRVVAALVAAIGLWSLALITYEVVVLLTPILVVSSFIGSNDRRWRRTVFMSLGIPLVACLTTVAVLRSRLDAGPAPGYTVRLEVGAVGKTIGKQLLASVPLAQFWLPGTAASWPDIDTISVMVGLLAGLAAVVALTRIGPGPASRRHLGWLAIIGAWLWIGPALLVGITARWQNELPWGQGYLSMVISSTGIAMMLGVAQRATTVAGPDPSTRAALRRMCRLTLTTTVALIVAGTAAVNVALVRVG